MHELSIACNLVEIVEEAARAAGAARVTRVQLRLGDLAGVVEEALRFSFPVAARGTLAEGAELAIEHVPVRVVCRQCLVAQTLTPPFVFRCSTCGALDVQFLQGRELQVESIEIEENHAGEDNDETAYP
uniref:Hydrogenase maturation factor HypA n=1 Tax=Caldilinea aerophila TaxID=133453 RepID=A0A7C1FHJ2_9CHLR